MGLEEQLFRQIFLQQECGDLSKYILSGNTEKVEHEMNRLITKFPEYRCLLYDMLAGHYMLARRYPAYDDYSKAISIYKKLLRLDDIKQEDISRANWTMRQE